MNIDTQLEAILSSNQLHEDLAAEIKRRIKAGASKETILVALINLREAASQQGGEASEDAVLDVMDRLVEWCSPGAKL